MTDATLSYVNGEPTLRFERRLRHAPAKVWRAVTDPAELKHWFPAEIQTELRPGAPMRFVFPDEAPVDNEWQGEVLEVDEPRVFMFRWDTDVVRIELVPDGDGCLLVFTQTIGGGQVGFLAAGRNAAGWDECLGFLVAQLDSTSAEQRTDWLGPVAHYIEKFGLGEGTVKSTSDGYEVRFVRDLMWKPPAQTWQVLTEGDAEPPARAVNDEVPAGRVVRVEPERLLEYEWLHQGEPAGTVRWEFHSDPKLGERVELTQTVLAVLPEVRPRAMAAWHLHLDLFFAAVMGDAHYTWSDARVAELTEHYTKQLN